MAIKRCTCEHKWMDARYGKKKRVFNTYKSQNGETSRCTVCGTELSGGSGKKR
jgi:hypothetical protein